ncbi:MAG: hypothetical protein H5T59_08820 [Anaerolineae bacterium]|nr:hypothetical protein [Anaerolineae bacterium]
MGVIDALSAGFATVARRAWLMVIPAVLDLFLWLGVRLSVEPLVREALAAAGSLQGADGTALLPEEGRAAILRWAAESNLFALLRTPGFLHQEASAGWLVPAAEGTMPSPAQVPGLQTPVLTIHRLEVAAAASAGLFLAGLFLAALYLCWVAQALRQEGTWLPSLREVARTWARFLGYTVALGVLLGMLGLPLMALVALALASGLSVLTWVVNLAFLSFMWVWIWLTVYLFFAVDAMVWNRVGVWAGVWTSIQVVGRNFWPTVGFFALSNVIAAGTTVIWHRIQGTLWGMPLAILGGAFIQTGLVAASFVFFRSRYARLMGVLAEEPEG